VEHLFSTDHDKQAEGNVPSPSQVSTGSEGSVSCGSSAGSDNSTGGCSMGWEERVAYRVRDYLRVRFPSAEARSLVEDVVPHIVFIHERGWTEYGDSWERETGARTVMDCLTMQRMNSDIAGNISALTLA